MELLPTKKLLVTNKNFQPSVTFHLETSHLIFAANQMTVYT